MNNNTCSVNSDELSTIDLSELVRRCLQMQPHASPDEVAEWLARLDVRPQPQLLYSLLAAMKTG